MARQSTTKQQKSAKAALEARPINDRKQLCRQCKYRAHASIKGAPKDEPYPSVICDYIGATGHSRMLICEAENCTVFEKGKALPDKATNEYLRHYKVGRGMKR